MDGCPESQMTESSGFSTPHPSTNQFCCRLRFVLAPILTIYFGGYLVIEQIVNYESGLAIVLLPCLRIPILSLLLATQTPISVGVN